MNLNLALGYQQQNDNKAIVLTDTTNNYNVASATILTNTTLTANVMYEIVDAGSNNFVDAWFRAPDNNPGTRFITDPGSGPIDLIITDGQVKEVTTSIPTGPAGDWVTGATLDVVFTGVSNTPITKPQIDLADEFGETFPPPIFNDQSEMVYTITSELLGDAVDALLPDGLYELTYKITYTTPANTGTASKTETLITTILVYGQVKVAVYDKYRQIPAWCNCKDDDALHKILETDLCGAYLIAIEHSAFIAKTEELINMLIVLDDMVKNGSKIYY